MIYLDNAATGGFKPASVQSAVAAALKLCANPGRSGHALSLALAERVLACRDLLSDLFDGYGYERTVFVKNCTEALNIAVLGVLKEGDHAVCTCLEHNSVLRPLEHLKERGLITYDVAPLSEGELLPENIAALVKPHTRAVYVTSASNVTGETPPLAAIRALLPEDVLLIVDGAQGAGHIPISMKKMGVDALAIAGHKGMHAMQGAAALLFSERLSPAPVLFGGTGSESFNLSMPAFYPDRLESGTLSYPAIASLFEGALFVRARREAHATQLTRLTSALLEGLGELQGFRAYSAPNACGIVSFAVEGMQSEEAAQALDRLGIAVRGGLHCAPLVHRALGTFPEGLVRVSFSPFQGMREVRALLCALRRVRTTSL